MKWPVFEERTDKYLEGRKAPYTHSGNKNGATQMLIDSMEFGLQGSVETVNVPLSRKEKRGKYSFWLSKFQHASIRKSARLSDFEADMQMKRLAVAHDKRLRTDP